MDFKKMKYQDIEDWCFANGQEAWLEEQLKAEFTFIQLKTFFANRFMPEIIPQAAPKAPTMLDKFNARKAAKK